MVSQIFAKYSDIQVEVTKEDLNTVVAQNPVFALKLELEATQRELRQAREQLARDATVLVDLQTELNTLKGRRMLMKTATSGQHQKRQSPEERDASCRRWAKRISLH